jgi:chromosome segregation ATPase
MAEPEISSECQEDFTDLRLAVGIIQHDLVSQSKITDKLAEAVEKIEEMNANLVKMIALHELKHENATDDLKELEHRFDNFRQGSVTTTTTTSTVEDEARQTLEQLNKWKYMIIGGALVVGALLSHVKWSVLLSIFGG